MPKIETLKDSPACLLIKYTPHMTKEWRRNPNSTISLYDYRGQLMFNNTAPAELAQKINMGELDFCQAMHELWRIDRVDKIYSTVTEFRKIYEKIEPQVFTSFLTYEAYGEHMTNVVASLRQGSEGYHTCKAFLTDSFAAILKNLNDKPLSEDLSKEDNEKIDLIARAILLKSVGETKHRNSIYN